MSQANAVGVDDGFVKTQQVRARFFERNGQELVELEAISDPRTRCSVVRKLAQHPELRDQFPREYTAFKEGLDVNAMELRPGAIPLDKILDGNVVAKIRAASVHSVQELASLSDGALPALGMGGMMWRQKALDYLESRNPAQPAPVVAEPDTRVDDMSAQISQLTESVAQLAQIVAASQTKRRPGRPRKAKAVEEPKEEQE